MRRLVAQIGKVGMDVVEVAPVMDAGTHITCLLAHCGGMEAMTRLVMRNLGLVAPEYMDPGLPLAPSRLAISSTKP